MNTIRPMIPDIKMTVPVPYEHEYASSSTAISPSYTRGLKNMEWNVSFDYAVFLIDNGHIKKEDYIEALMEETFSGGALADTYQNFSLWLGEEEADTLLRQSLERKIDKAVKKNESRDWEDWV